MGIESYNRRSSSPRGGASLSGSLKLIGVCGIDVETYGSTVWHGPSETKDARKRMVNKLAVIQN